MADGCTNIVLRNDSGERGECGRRLFRKRLCEDCFFEKLSRLNAEYESHKKNMKAAVRKIGELFEIKEPSSDVDSPADN